MKNLRLTKFFTNTLSVDIDVLMVLLQRGWMAAGGIISVILISNYVTKENQGYYYTFATLLAGQMFFDFGINQAVFQKISHKDAANNSKEEVFSTRNPNTDIILIVRKATSITLWQSVFYFLGALCYFYLLSLNSQKRDLIVAAALIFAPSIWIMRTNVLMSANEGLGKISTVALCRLISAVVASMGLWAGILYGAGYYAMAASQVLYAFTQSFTAKFLAITFTSPAEGIINWKNSVWPHQWRLALSGLSNYLALMIPIPILALLGDPVLAGATGMTLQICGAITGFSSTWVNSKMHKYSALASKKKFFELKLLHSQCVKASWFAVFVFTALAGGSLFAAHSAGILKADRLLPISMLYLVILIIVSLHFFNIEGALAQSLGGDFLYKIAVFRVALLALPWFVFNLTHEQILQLSFGFSMVVSTMLVQHKMRKVWLGP